MSLRQTLLVGNKPTIVKPRGRLLRNLNLIAFLLHGASFIAALVVSIIYQNNSYRGQITTDFRSYGPNSTAMLDVVSDYPLIWVDLPFPFVTAMFHGAIVFVPFVSGIYANDKTNPLRWIEYSITASLMMWVIMQLAGITNIFMLVMLGLIGNVALQYQGYIQEKIGRRSLLPTAIGWLIFSAQWSMILAYFFSAGGADTAPWFVSSIVIGTFVLFAMFGLIQLFHMLGAINTRGQEIMYVVMSLTAKLYLTWNLLIGTATQ